MQKDFVYYDFVDVYDDKIFTHERGDEWKDYIVESYKSVYAKMKSRLDYSTPIQFSVNRSLLEETIIDAIIGMRKIITSDNNGVEDPNSFKIISYLAYWWLRHKPVCVYYPPDYDLKEEIEISTIDGEAKTEYEKRRNKTVWQLKHMNELVAVQMVINYIFNIDAPICDKKQCGYVSNKNNGNFTFESFDDMYIAILKKLTYYFSYRPLTPKVIEHILEAYTFHPAWALTGRHWEGD